MLKILTWMSQLLKHSLAHIYNSVMQMWEVFLRGVMSGSSVAIILLESLQRLLLLIRLKTQVGTD